MTIKEEILEAYKMQKESYNFLHKIMAREGIIFDDIRVPVTDKTIKPEKVVQLVEDIFNTSVLNANRKQSTIFGRQAAAYLLRIYTKLSLSEISKYIGVSDHTTVHYSIKKCGDLMKTENWYKEKIVQLCEELDEYTLYLSK